MINERKLSKLIKVSNIRNYVNVFEDYMQYTDGYMIAVINYNNFTVINKLCSVGAFESLRTLKPKNSVHLENILKLNGEEVEITKTDFIIKYGDEYFNIFNINGTCYAYQKAYIDIFEDVTFKIDTKDSDRVPKLRIYNDEGNFEGAVMGFRYERLNEKIKALCEID